MKIGEKVTFSTNNLPEGTIINVPEGNFKVHLDKDSTQSCDNCALLDNQYCVMAKCVTVSNSDRINRYYTKLEEK